MREAILIDDSIREYNKVIQQTLDAENAVVPKGRWHLVDICAALQAMAWKRNAGNPTYKWPEELRLLHPGVDTKYYLADTKGRLSQGGIFSLDGVHPTAIGQGLVAYEFLKVMRNAGTVAKKTALDWQAILRSDRLYQEPIPLMGELYQHGDLANFVVKCIGAFRD